MKEFINLVAREMRIAWVGGGIWMPIIFFLAVATLYPFVTGPDRMLLGKTGGGILWIAALLASLLPMERIILPDYENGILDQLALRGWSDEWVAGTKMIGHSLSFGLPLLIACFVGSALVGLPETKLTMLIGGLALALPALSGLSVTIAALTAGLNGASALAGLLLIPLAVPILIFGVGTLGDQPASALQLLGATSLAIAALSPFAAGAALRALRE